MQYKNNTNVYNYSKIAVVRIINIIFLYILSLISTFLALITIAIFYG